MMKIGVLLLVALPLLQAADEFVKPEKVPISTWVREDYFAGWIAHDTQAFERSVRKVDLFLQDHPNDQIGLGWKFALSTYRMREAVQQKDSAAYARESAIAKQLRDRIFAGDVQDPG